MKLVNSINTGPGCMCSKGKGPSGSRCEGVAFRMMEMPSSHCGGPFSPEAAVGVPADTNHAPLVLDCSFGMTHIWLSTCLSSGVIREYPEESKASWKVLWGEGREVVRGARRPPSWVVF